MKILVFSQYYYPESFRINDLCEELVKKGHEVTVVTGYPNYPLGKIYDGYGIFKKYENVHNGVKIKRIPMASRGKSAAHMFLNMVSYIISGCIWSILNREKYDLAYVFEVSPVTVAIPAIFNKKKIGLPVIMNVQDLWPENVEIVLGIHNRIILSIINKTVDWIYKNCDLLLASSDSFVENITKRGHNAGKVKFWPQFCERIKIQINNMVKPSEYSNNFKIVFTGNIGYAQGLGTAIEAAKILKNKPIDWYFIGDGRAKNELELQSKGLSNVYFLGRKKSEEIPIYLHYADCALVILDDNKVFNMTIPAKLQTYLSCAVPIVASSGGEVKRIIEEAKCGIVCKPGSAKTLADAILDMHNKDKLTLNEMAANAAAYHEKHFEKDMLINELENYFKAVEK